MKDLKDKGTYALTLQASTTFNSKSKQAFTMVAIEIVQKKRVLLYLNTFSGSFVKLLAFSVGLGGPTNYIPGPGSLC